jgi:hypothetical protein
LETLFVAELMAPGSRLLVVSPWVSDFPVVDNRSGQFSQLDTRWGASRIRLSDVLRSMLIRGTQVNLACRPGPREDEFAERLESAAMADGSDSFLRLRQGTDVAFSDRAHEKALVGDSWALYGSMNFTYSGVELNGELVTFTTDVETVATMAAELATLFREA